MKIKLDADVKKGFTDVLGNDLPAVEETVNNALRQWLEWAKQELMKDYDELIEEDDEEIKTNKENNENT